MPVRRFLFTPELHGVPIRKLSGGEKRRLCLLKLLMSAPNVLLLDEPTNDLDIPTLEVLEDFLDTFSGVVITVCHDRYFLDRVVDKLFVFTGEGQIEIIHGAYSEYKDALEAGRIELYGGASETKHSKREGRSENGMAMTSESEAAVISKAESMNTSEPETVFSSSIEAASLGSANAQIPSKVVEPAAVKPLNLAEQEKLCALEDDIAELEGLLKAYDAMINQNSGDFEALQTTMKERAQVEAKWEAKTERWMELSDRL